MKRFYLALMLCLFFSPMAQAYTTISSFKLPWSVRGWGVSNDGAYVATLKHGTIKVFESKTTREIYSVNFPYKIFKRMKVAVSPDGQFVAVRVPEMRNASIYLYKRAENKWYTFSISVKNYEVHLMTFADNSSYLITTEGPTGVGQAHHIPMRLFRLKDMKPITISISGGYYYGGVYPMGSSILYLGKYKDSRNNFTEVNLNTLKYVRNFPAPKVVASQEKEMITTKGERLVFINDPMANKVKVIDVFKQQEVPLKGVAIKNIQLLFYNPIFKQLIYKDNRKEIFFRDIVTGYSGKYAEIKDRVRFLPSSPNDRLIYYCEQGALEYINVIDDLEEGDVVTCPAA